MPDTVDQLFLSFQTALSGRYSLERELGRGGMGVVYLAREVRLDRLVAIKLLPPEFAAHDRLRARFLREARTAARLSHPYIVPIHSVDQAGEFVFYVMAYVEGETLTQRVMSRGPVPPGEATRILREVAWALAYAHAQGVIHRDIKPANILLEVGTERAMVTDFGIARLAHASGDAEGELLGTPEYMSPEQASGEPLDGRSDLYSLGVVGFFALTGRLPFIGSSAQSLLAQHITKSAPSVSSVARGVPTALAHAIDQCLQKDPADRPATGEVLADALAPAMAKRAEVPVPVRVLIDRRRAMAMIMPPIIVNSMAINFIVELMRHGTPPTYKIAAAAALSAASIAAPLVILMKRLRTVLRLGYGTDDIAAGLRASYDRRREEFQYEFGTKVSFRERTFRSAAVSGVLAAAGITAGIASGAFPATAIPFAILAFDVGIFGIAFTSKWKRLREGKGPRLARFWEGRIGQKISAISGFRLGQRAIPANRPTELAISMSAEALFAKFPKEMRESLGDVPTALHALEAHARAARAHIEELDATIDQALHGPGQGASAERQEALVADLRAARASAEERLAQVVSAMENVRLNLLRLQAGVGSVESVTQDLDAARAIGDGAARLLEGVHEAEEAIKR
ncbi:MAG: serine/threonine-protein kinase [Gemmatimonadaceae bacterium]